MLKSTCILFTLFWLTCLSAPTQDGSDLFLTADELNGGETLTTAIYDGKSLWGYINGGADIYLEYGFRQAFVQEIRYNGALYKIDIYRMNDPESAYGIFSVSTFRCSDTESNVSRDYCETRYQVQFTRADHYVSITNETGGEEGINYNRYLASQIGSKTEESKYEFPDLFQVELFQQVNNQGIKLIKGELGLQNGFAFWSGKFTFPGKYKIILLPMEVEGGEINLAILEFKGKEERVAFCETNKLDLPMDGEMVCRELKGVDEYYFQYNTNRIIMLESFSPEEATSRYVQAVEEFLYR